MASWLRRDVFSYADKPADLLYRHYRRWRFCVITCGAATIGTISTVWEFMTSFDVLNEYAPWFATLLVMLIGAGCLTFFALAVPALLALPLMEEIERTLADRGLPPPPRRLDAYAIPKLAMKMCFYAVALMLFAQWATRH